MRKRAVLEKEAFDAMEKFVTVNTNMTKIFARKAVALRSSCDGTKKEIEVLEQTLLGLEAKKPNCKPSYYIIKTVVIHISFN